MNAIATSNCAIVFGHLEVSGYQMFRGIPNHEGLTPQDDRPDHWFDWMRKALGIDGTESEDD